MLLTLRQLARELSQRAGRVVLTGGTFDLLHVGHLAFLEWCRSYGDILVVCVAGDRRVRRRKGLARPILPAEQRAQLVAALKPVTYVFIADSRPFTPRIMRTIRPQVVATAGDEPSRAVKEQLRQYVTQRYPDVEVRLWRRTQSRYPGLSSSHLINRIRRLPTGQ